MDDVSKARALQRVEKNETRLTTWRQITEAASYFSGPQWLFRGHSDASWALKTSLERDFGQGGADIEIRLLNEFVRRAPRFLPGHLVPRDKDAAAWLGLIQHYGGPTRLLDVTRSLYAALFFAYEPVGPSERAVWVFDHVWCQDACSYRMAHIEGIDEWIGRIRMRDSQHRIVAALVYRKVDEGDQMFRTFKPFSGVFPLDPWRPDIRQSAQQGLFLCAGDASLSFVDNLAVLGDQPIYKLILPSDLRMDVLGHLAAMNVTAATLFPDLTGLARSLRTYGIRPSADLDVRLPWANDETDR